MYLFFEDKRLFCKDTYINMNDLLQVMVCDHVIRFYYTSTNFVTCPKTEYNLNQLNNYFKERQFNK